MKKYFKIYILFVVLMPVLFGSTILYAQQEETVPDYRVFFRYIPANNPERVQLLAANTDQSHLTAIYYGETPTGELRWSAVDEEVYFMLSTGDAHGINGASLRGGSTHLVERFAAADYDVNAQNHAIVSRRESPRADNLDLVFILWTGRPMLFDRWIHLPETPHSEVNPRWSPDGSAITYMSNVNGNWDIFTRTMHFDGMRLDAGDEQLLTSSSANDRFATWSPDGSQIAFHSDRTGRPEIYVMEADGSNMRQITTGGGARAAWSPDGEYIVFNSDRGDSVDLYIVAVSGGTEIQITDLPGNEFGAQVVENPFDDTVVTRQPFDPNASVTISDFVLDEGIDTGRGIAFYIPSASAWRRPRAGESLFATGTALILDGYGDGTRMEIYEVSPEGRTLEQIARTELSGAAFGALLPTSITLDTRSLDGVQLGVAAALDQEPNISATVITNQIAPDIVVVFRVTAFAENFQAALDDGALLSLGAIAASARPVATSDETLSIVERVRIPIGESRTFDFSDILEHNWSFRAEEGELFNIIITSEQASALRISMSRLTTNGTFQIDVPVRSALVNGAIRIVNFQAPETDDYIINMVSSSAEISYEILIDWGSGY